MLDNRLHEHVYNHHLSNYQIYSLYINDSTLKIHNYIVDNKNKVTALTLLDFSAAFYTIDHLIPLQCFHIDILAFLAQLFGGSNHIFLRQIPKHCHIWHINLPTTHCIRSAARIRPWPCSVQLIFHAAQPNNY